MKTSKNELSKLNYGEKWALNIYNVHLRDYIPVCLKLLAWLRQVHSFPKKENNICIFAISSSSSSPNADVCVFVVRVKEFAA